MGECLFFGVVGIWGVSSAKLESPDIACGVGEEE
jgi:hypothetical protein